MLLGRGLASARAADGDAALALGVANRVLMLEFATYSVISPEGCAAILWKSGERSPEAAEAFTFLQLLMVLLLAHFGRPKGAPDPQYSLAPVAVRLGELLDARQRLGRAGDVVHLVATAADDVAGDGDGLDAPVGLLDREGDVGAAGVVPAACARGLSLQRRLAVLMFLNPIVPRHGAD